LGLSAALALPVHAASNIIAASNFCFRQFDSIYFLLAQNRVSIRSGFDRSF